MTLRNRIKSCRGATMLEYAIALGALLAVFVVFGLMLQRGSDARRDRSMETVEQAAPCGDGGNLSGDQCL